MKKQLIATMAATTLGGITIALENQTVRADETTDANQTATTQTLTHTVQVGDTLSDLAQTYSTTVASLVEQNSIQNQNLIIVGQKLVVGTTTQKTIETSTPTETAKTKISYTVQAGDTVSAIADRFNVSVNEIGQWNKLANVHLIFIGQTLTIEQNAETPAPVETPAVETPVAETPAPVETPVAETPVAETPVAETPAPVETPTVETPTPVETPAVETPVVETPAPVETTTETPVVETPAPVETTTETPVVETPAPVETTTETPVAETPAPVETTTETPVAETPAPVETTTETPVVETPAPVETTTETPVAETPAPVETPAVETPKQENVAVNGIYTVQSGETIGTIADKNGVSVDDIVSWNNLSNVNMIFVGQKLTVVGTTTTTPKEETTVVVTPSTPSEDKPVVIDTNTNTSTPTNTVVSSDATLNALNDLRVSKGLNPVVWDSDLAATATARAYTMANNGYNIPNDHWRRADEVIAFYFAPGIPVINAWYYETNMITASGTGHRDWELNPNITRVGFGYSGNAIVGHSR